MLNILWILFRMKKDTWVKIESEFNCQCIENSRSAVVLKNKYEK